MSVVKFDKVPHHLWSDLLSKVCRKNFTISELILCMINNDDFRVELHGLNIRVLREGKLLFNEDVLSFDILTFISDEMLTKFDNLLKGGWITIAKITTSSSSELHAYFSFLMKYGGEKNYELNSNNRFPRSLKDGDKIIIDTKRLYFRELISIYQEVAFYKDSQNDVTIRIDGIRFVGLFKYWDELKFANKRFLNEVHFEVGVSHKFELRKKYFVSETIRYLQEYEIYVNGTSNINVTKFEVCLDFFVDEVESSGIYPFIHEFCQIVDTKVIKSLKFLSRSDEKLHLDFSFISLFPYLEKIEVVCDMVIDYKTFGSLKDMKYLKAINFLYADVKYEWLNECLPDNLQMLRLFQNNEYDSDNLAVFRIPRSLKTLEIEIDDSQKGFDFSRFAFEDALKLKSIHLLNFMHDSEATEVKISGIDEFPKSVKFLLFYDNYQDLSRSESERVKISGVKLDGIYSNIDTYDEHLGMVRIQHSLKCFII